MSNLQNTRRPRAHQPATPLTPAAAARLETAVQLALDALVRFTNANPNLDPKTTNALTRLLNTYHKLESALRANPAPQAQPPQPPTQPTATPQPATPKPHPPSAPNPDPPARNHAPPNQNPLHPPNPRTPRNPPTSPPTILQSPIPSKPARQNPLSPATQLHPTLHCKALVH